MRSHLIIVAALGATAIGASLNGSSLNGGDINSSSENANLVKPELSSQVKSNSWRISVEHSGRSCLVAHGSQMGEFGFALENNPKCQRIQAELGNFASIKFTNDGDIMLFDQNGKRVAQFMQAELEAHESIWPNYPHMMLSRVDAR